MRGPRRECEAGFETFEKKLKKYLTKGERHDIIIKLSRWGHREIVH